MKSKLAVAWILVAVAACVLAFFKQRDVARLTAIVSNLEREVAEARGAAEQAAEAAKPDPAELERLKNERDELIRLRGEVAGLRRDKESWDKKLAADKAAAATAAAAAAAQRDRQQAAAEQGAQAVDAILNGPAAVKGAESGNLGRKLLSGQPLNPTEQELLNKMMAKTKEIEKNPEEFANFQTAFVESLLGWQNDERSARVRQVLTAASNAALTRGFDFNAPAQNAEAWTDQQRALNTRATGAVQGLLTPEERAVFDRAFIGVLGVDFGMRAPTPAPGQ